MSKVVRKNTIISAEFAGVATDSSINRFLEIPFQPDEMIVNGIAWYSTGAVTAGSQTCKVRTNILDSGEYLLAFAVSASGLANTHIFSPMKLHFTITKPMKGIFRFDFLTFNNATGLDDLITLTGKIEIHLEFIKYK